MKLTDVKYKKIKALIDEMSLDPEWDRGNERPLVSATTALNTIDEIWSIIYDKVDTSTSQGRVELLKQGLEGKDIETLHLSNNSIEEIDVDWQPQSIKAGDPCPDCGSKFVVCLVCSNDDCGHTIHPADGYQIQR